MSLMDDVFDHDGSMKHDSFSYDESASLLSHPPLYRRIWEGLQNLFTSCRPPLYLSSDHSYRLLSEDEDTVMGESGLDVDESEQLVGMLEFPPVEQPTIQRPLYLRVWEAICCCFTSCGPSSKDVSSPITTIIPASVPSVQKQMTPLVTILEQFNTDSQFITAADTILHERGPGVFQKDRQLLSELYGWCSEPRMDVEMILLLLQFQDKGLGISVKDVIDDCFDAQYGAPQSNPELIERNRNEAQQMLASASPT